MVGWREVESVSGFGWEAIIVVSVRNDFRQRQEISREKKKPECLERRKYLFNEQRDFFVAFNFAADSEIPSRRRMIQGNSCISKVKK